MNLGRWSTHFGPDSQSQLMLNTYWHFSSCFILLIYMVVKNLLTWSVIKDLHVKCKDTKQILFKVEIFTIHRVHKAQATEMSKRQNLWRNMEDRIKERKLVIGCFYLLMCRDFKTLHTWLESQAYPSCLWRFGGHWKKLRFFFFFYHVYYNTSKDHIWNFPGFKRQLHNI